MDNAHSSTIILQLPTTANNAGAAMQEAQAVLVESRNILAELREFAFEFRATTAAMFDELRALRRLALDASGSPRTDRHTPDIQDSLLDLAIHEVTQPKPDLSLGSQSQHEARIKEQPINPDDRDLLDHIVQFESCEMSPKNEACTSSTERSTSEEASSGRQSNLRDGSASPHENSPPEPITFHTLASDREHTPREDVLKSALNTASSPTPPTPQIKWALKFPFADRAFRSSLNYLTSQVLEINITEKLVEGHWQIPRTIVVCTTLPMMERAYEKLQRCVSDIQSRHPGTDFGNGIAIIWDHLKKEQILQTSTDFIGKRRSILVCPPVRAAEFLTADVTQVFWSNLRTEGIISLLSAFESCEKSLIMSLRVTVIFDKADSEQAWTIKNWLEETGAQVVTDVQAIDRHFSSMI